MNQKGIHSKPSLTIEIFTLKEEILKELVGKIEKQKRKITEQHWRKKDDNTNSGMLMYMTQGKRGGRTKSKNRTEKLQQKKLETLIKKQEQTMKINKTKERPKEKKKKCSLQVCLFNHWQTAWEDRV